MSCRNCKYSEIENNRCYCKKKCTIIKKYENHICAKFVVKDKLKDYNVLDNSTILRYIHNIERRNDGN